MREIEFRGKRIDGNKNWVIGNLIGNNPYYIIASENIKIDYNHTLSNTSVQLVDPKTVGQYTGLKDKNDKKIYEGDIININEAKWGVVEFYHSQWYVKDARFIFNLHLDCHVCEITSNIHENPELLDM